MPGRRLGWIKMKVKLCNACCSQKQAERMMAVAQIPLQATPPKIDTRTPKP